MRNVWVHSDYSQAEARVVAWAGPVPALKTWFHEGKDVHLNVAKMIGQVVQRGKFELPNNLFNTKHFEEFNADDPERQVSKSTVHGNNYGLGIQKYSLITGLPERYARLLQDIYFGLFPEIRTGYQAGIDRQLEKDSTIYIPLGWKRRYYDIPGPERSRAAYAGYAQSTVGGMLVRVLTRICEWFEQDLPEATIVTPERILQMGYDVRLNSHDAIESILPDSEDVINTYCKIVSEVGETPIMINGEPLVIPMDHAIGPNLGELKKRKIK